MARPDWVARCCYGLSQWKHLDSLGERIEAQNDDQW
jgi:hypothetical protein